MIRTITFLACTFFLLTVRFAHCQDNQIKVKVFDGTPQPKGETAPNTKYNNKNFLNINPYLLGRGVFAVGYERVLHFKHSLQLDLGLAYRDFVHEATLDQGLGLGSDRKVNVKTGSYLSAGYKFYPKGFHDFDGGFYVSPSVILKNYNLSEDIEYNTSTTTLTATVDRSYSMQEVALKFGYSSESWWFDDLISDFYFGVGSREITTNSYENTNNTLTLTRQTERKPALYLGVKLGFVF